MNPETVGDYATPEQVVGEINMKDPWESCITISNQWAWKPNDKMKDLKQSIQTLVSTAGGNGNLLYNVGPMLDGRMEQRQIDLLSQMGAWLNKNGVAVYGTQGGPYKPNKDFACTRKGNKIYLHLFNQHNQSIKLAAIPSVKINKAYFLNGAAVTFTQDEGGIIINLPATLPDSIDTIVVLELNKDAVTIPLIEN